jgi:hypothetical protein
MGVALSHRIEPGIRVQKVTLAEDTPALKFIPTGAGPWRVEAGRRHSDGHLCEILHRAIHATVLLKSESKAA